MMRPPARRASPSGLLRRPGRAGFTLMEVTLASAIGLLIMYGLYVAISVQLKFTDAGRHVVEQATLARSLTARIAADITPCVGQPDPARYQQQQGQSGASGSGQSGAG